MRGCARRGIVVALAVVLAALASPAGAQVVGGPRAQDVVPGRGTGRDADVPLVPWRGLLASEDRVVVRYEAGVGLQARSQLHASLGARVVRALGPDHALLEVPDGGPLDALLARVGSRAGVLHADPDVLLPTVGAPPLGDPKANLQWYLGPVQAEAGWALAAGAPDVVVAVLDTGVLTTHPDLADRIAWGHDFHDGDTDPTDTNGHGTHCAGIVSAVRDNGVGIAGMAGACRIAAYRCGSGSSLYSSHIIAGVNDAVANGAQVLSMSFGAPVDLSSIHDALVTAHDAGCVLVAAAGNDGVDSAFYPAAYDEVVGVASSAPNDSRSTFSNHGAWVSVAAPGQSIYSTYLSDGYGYMSGTSMACPLVAGMAALLYAQVGGERSVANAALVRAALEESAAPVGYVAHGRVDLVAALDALGAGDAPTLASLSPSTVDALGDVEVTVTGTGLLGATGADVGGLPVGVTVVDDTTLTFTAPPAPLIGAVPLTVLEGAASSAPLTLAYEVVDPPRLVAPAYGGVGETLEWSFGAQPGDAWILLASLSGATVEVAGWKVLETFVVGRLGLLDDEGLGASEAVVPASAAGVTLHVQVVSGPGWLAGATPVAATPLHP